MLIGCLFEDESGFLFDSGGHDHRLLIVSVIVRIAKNRCQMCKFDPGH